MMKRTQFDAKTGGAFTVEVEGPSFDERIVGPGYFIIVNPQSTYACFSKSRQDICFGDIVSDMIPNYTNAQYAKDYGSRILHTGQTIREYMAQNCYMKV
jgi:hypothetical protein